MEEQGKRAGQNGIRLVLDVHRNEDDGKGGDKEAASIVTDGCNMGIKTICGYKISIPVPQRPPWNSRTSSPGWKKNCGEQMKRFL